MFTQSFTVDLCSLKLLDIKETATIRKIKNSNEQICARLTALGIEPGVSVTLEQKFPFLLIKVADNYLALNPELASSIYVKQIRNI